MYIHSPLNYTGGKYSLLNDILPCFPDNLNNFVDLFTGGLNVGINVTANTIYANDQIDYLIEMYEYFQKTDIDEILSDIYRVIDEYKLVPGEIESYHKLRSDYNSNQTPLKLFVLTCYCFNHLIRFNNSHEFNTSVGLSGYNSDIEKNLLQFLSALKHKNFIFSTGDFRNFDFSPLVPGDLVYCDPPYLISVGPYNDGKRGFGDWHEQEETDLLNLLDDLNAKGIYFALSNVLYHKGEANTTLIEWSKKYNITYLDKEYSNCNYHIKNKDGVTVEVLVTNYEVPNKPLKQFSLF